MAAAVFKVYTLRDEARTIVDDWASGLGVDSGDWLTDDQYDSVLLPLIQETTEQTYTLTKRTTGIYTYQFGADLYLSNQVTPFTGDADVTYSVFARGLTVKSVTSGGVVQVDHSGDISIVGVPVNFNAYIAALFGYLKSQRATEITQSIDSATFTIDNTIARLNGAIGYWEGITVSAN